MTWNDMQKNYEKSIKKDLKVNELDLNKIYDCWRKYDLYLNIMS